MATMHCGKYENNVFAVVIFTKKEESMEHSLGPKLGFGFFFNLTVGRGKGKGANGLEWVRMGGTGLRWVRMSENGLERVRTG